MTTRTRLNLAVAATLAALVGAGVVAMKVISAMDPDTRTGTPFSVTPR